MSILDHVKYKNQNLSTKNSTGTNTNSQQKRVVLVKKTPFQTVRESAQVVQQRPPVCESKPAKGSNSSTISSKRRNRPSTESDNTTTNTTREPKTLIHKSLKKNNFKVKLNSFEMLGRLFGTPEEPEQSHTPKQSIEE
jgi:hypothetical protein